MSTNQNKLEQGRALQAFELAKNAYNDNFIDKDELKSYAKKIPMMIQTNGLGNAFAFMAAKGRSYKRISKDIVSWLSHKDCPFQLAPEHSADFIKYIIEVDSSVYRAYSTEIIAFMGWYKRFIEGFAVTK